MPTPVILPALGESVSEGTVVRWLKEVGDAVTLDEPLLEVSTDKVDTEIPSPATGVLLQIDATEDEVVKIGAQIALIGASQDSDAATSPTAPPALRAPAFEGPVVDSGFLSPLVRRLAAQHGIDPASIAGTGSGGRVRKEDLVARVGAVASAAPTAPASPPSTTGGQVQALAQLTQVIEVDLTAVVRLCASSGDGFLAREGVALTYAPLVAKAAIDALAQHPRLNAVVDADSGELTPLRRRSIAVALTAESAGPAPVVHDAGDLSIAALARKLADFAHRGPSVATVPRDDDRGTFTVTYVGPSATTLFDTPIVNPAQVAALSCGSVVKRAVVIDAPDLGEAIVVRDMVYLALSYDHRVLDRADAGRFLSSIQDRLEAAQFSL